jgi:hypothetical protein
MEKENARSNRKGKKVVKVVEKVIRVIFNRKLGLSGNEREIRRPRPYSKIK